MPKEFSKAEYLLLRNYDCGASDWLVLDQRRIDAFADATEDRHFIHTDPVRAKETRFGSTVAHGFLTLSLIAGFAYQVVPEVTGGLTGANLGFDRVRLILPVPAGSRVRGAFVIRQVTERANNAIERLIDVAVELEGSAKPAAVAEWRTVVFVGGMHDPLA
jgi:acyl dehydratase